MNYDNRDLISGFDFTQLARLHRGSRRSTSSSHVESPTPAPVSSSPKQSLIQPRRRFFR